VVTPTGVDAERVADDLACLLPRGTADRAASVVGAVEGPVAVLPAWETLPFERVSPEVETMGRRLALLWSLTHGENDPSLPAPPRVIVAPIRALLQRLGPTALDAGPTTVRPGQELSVDELLARLIAVGYRREHQVEHRGEVAVRGGIIDVFPSTADTPVRIDLWGDEVDRLTAFAVNDQRSLADLDLAVFFGCR
jgi:transcription-repair coupling factor (superfamily II helicase)